MYNTYIYTYTCTLICIDLSMDIYIYIYTHIFIYIYIQIYKDVHAYIHIRIFGVLDGDSRGQVRITCCHRQQASSKQRLLPQLWMKARASWGRRIRRLGLRALGEVCVLGD